MPAIAPHCQMAFNQLKGTNYAKLQSNAIRYWTNHIHLIFGMNPQELKQKFMAVFPSEDDEQRINLLALTCGRDFIEATTFNLIYSNEYFYTIHGQRILSMPQANAWNLTILK